MKCLIFVVGLGLVAQNAAGGPPIKEEMPGQETQETTGEPAGASFPGTARIGDKLYDVGGVEIADCSKVGASRCLVIQGCIANGHSTEKCLKHGVPPEDPPEPPPEPPKKPEPPEEPKGGVFHWLGGIFGGGKGGGNGGSSGGGNGGSNQYGGGNRGNQ